MSMPQRARPPPYPYYYHDTGQRGYLEMRDALGAPSPLLIERKTCIMAFKGWVSFLGLLLTQKPALIYMMFDLEEKHMMYDPEEKPSPFEEMFGTM